MTLWTVSEDFGLLPTSQALVGAVATLIFCVLAQMEARCN